MAGAARRRVLGLAASLAAVVVLGTGHGVPERSVKPVDSPALGGEDRYLAHLATDRPFYKPGDTVHGRAAVLDAFSRKPHPGGQGRVSFEVQSPKGDVVESGTAGLAEAFSAFSWKIPPRQAGGRYTLVAKFPDSGYPDGKTEFTVRAYRVPRLRTQIEFLKKAYGPGDEVTATLEASRAEGGIPSGARVTAVASVDGGEVHREELALGDSGSLEVRFKLPADMASGLGNLAFIVRDGGVQETAVKTIPIVLARVDLKFYPEGGELTAGLPCRVYLEARDRREQPADVAGRIVDASGREVARFSSEHEGRGRFAFVPEAGSAYRAVVEQPAGIEKPVELPPVRGEGAVLQTTRDVLESAAPLTLNVAATRAGEMRLTVARFEKIVAERSVTLEKGTPAPVDLDLPAGADGVLRVTLWTPGGIPVAERLVFRRPRTRLEIRLTPEPAAATPGSRVSVAVVTTDASGEPVPSIVSLRVVDDALLETVDRREQAPGLPVQALLGSDVRELRDPAAYLTGDEAGDLKTDLLLGTQGWRRFVFLENRLQGFLSEHEEAARRVLAQRTPPQDNIFEMEGGMAFPAAMPQGMMEVRAVGAVMEKGEEPDALGGEMAAGPDEVVDGPPQEVAEPEMAQAAPMEADAMGMAFEAGAARPLADEEFAMGRRMRVPAPAQAQYVREYAHRQPSSRPGTARQDFAETLYWNAGLATDDAGRALVTFDLCDSVTSFRVTADAVGKDGALGGSAAVIESRKPFYVEAKLPLEVTAGDRPEIPVSLINGMDEPLEVEVDLRVSGTLEVTSQPPSNVTLSGQERRKIYVPLEVGAAEGDAGFELGARSGRFRDEVSRKMSVVPSGFPIELTFGGRLAEHASHEVIIPEETDPASVVTHAAIHPSPLASLTEALAALLQEPSGCFEQTSSSNYPNVMILQYLQSHRVEDSQLLARTRELMGRGYERLVGYESSGKGYEWFGGDPGHEALTAYGLMEFVDMAQVHPVDAEMVERTRKWLLGRRDGKGGFERNPQALDSFGAAPPDVTNAYIVWALSEAGTSSEMPDEIAAVRDQAQKSDDPYLVALAAKMLAKVGDPAAPGLMRKLAGFQKEDGRVTDADTSITRSAGTNLEVETTSLAVLAWLEAGEFTGQVEKAMGWLLESCKSGRFGATQATVLALKAVIAYDTARARPKRAGTALLLVDGKVIDEVPFGPEKEAAIVMPSFAKQLSPGKHRVELKMVEGSEMPYSITVAYHSKTPASAAECRVGLETVLDREAIAEGETVDLRAKITNETGEGLPMTVAIIGLPGGLETRADQLEELVKSKTVDFYETRGREVILYYRALAPRAVREVVLNLVAAIPGSYTAPASRAYLYYDDEHKRWVQGLKARVTR